VGDAAGAGAAGLVAAALDLRQFGHAGHLRRVLRGRGRDGARGRARAPGIEPAVELGVGLFRVTERMRVFAEVRKGFGGHGGWVGEAGADLLLRPSDRLVLSAGPRAYFGDGEFTRTCFGVSREEAARSSLTAFRPDGGLVSLGTEVNARHYFADGWSLLGTLGWRRLQADAAQSPITRQGSADQDRARFIVTRTFSFGR
jgi:MipA family protein